MQLYACSKKYIYRKFIFANKPNITSFLLLGEYFKVENYKIITLGTSGAGKTVFLASLFKQLSLPTDEGIYLDVQNAKQQKELNGIYTQVANKESWPIGTKELTEWCFTCYVRTQNLENYPVCKFSYIDYKGGMLTDLDKDDDLSDSTFNFRQEIPKANAVIVLIDGRQLYEFIRTGFDLSDPGITKWLTNDLPNTIQLANRVKKNPVHFVITKWDLLEGQYDLSTIRESLKSKCKEFEKLVDGRVKAGCPVRLIPISSVGNEFVTMQPDGSMKKNLGKVPKPFQLEIPLSYVLIDKVATYYNHIDKGNKDFEESVQNKFGFLLDLIPDTVKRGKQLTHEERIQNLKNVSDTKTAFTYLIETFVANITEFEKNYPEAKLGGDVKIPDLTLGVNKKDEEDKDSNTFTCNQEQFDNLTENLKNWLDKEGYKHQHLKTENDAILIQIGKQGIFRELTGMAEVLNIHLNYDKKNMKVKFSGGKWLDKLGFATVGTLFFPPLAITAGIGTWKQSRLPKRIINFISKELT